MVKRVIVFFILLGAVSLVSGGALAAPRSFQQFQRPLSRPVYWHPKAAPPAGYFSVNPHIFDPGHINEAQAKWLPGLGCIAAFSPLACGTGDGEDQVNSGMLLAKSGATGDNVAAFVTITSLGHPAPLEFGYDIRNGGHCGAGAPRFNVLTNDSVTHFIGCISPPPTSATSDVGWTRLRWGDKTNSIMPPAFPDFLPGNTIVSVQIVFDEGIDTGPDNSGAVILDNIDINGILVGRNKCLPSSCP
ncbi:MAG: hypothetical protein ACHQY2_04115 [Candidatus Eremiobacterales bacterium]|jgi:hypothetical protein